MAEPASDTVLTIAELSNYLDISVHALQAGPERQAACAEGPPSLAVPPRGSGRVAKTEDKTIPDSTRQCHDCHVSHVW
jgi:hypothetical protein